MNNNYYASPAMERIRGRLERLYGPSAPRLLSRLAMMMGRYGLEPGPRAPLEIDERACMLIAYADSVRNPAGPSLPAMRRFLEKHVGKTVTHLHLLPFWPSSSDDGFSVKHFRTVEPRFGGWADVQALGQSYRMVFDLVLNHVSSQSGWFQDFTAGVAPGRDYFIAADPGGDFSNVVRPRSHPLFTPFATHSGVKNVWTTFSADQVDLDYSNPDVLFEMLDIVLFYAAMGARVLRLDAIAYLWKRAGTSCLNLAETHEIIRLMRDMLALAAPDVLLLSETNLPHAENMSYFGAGDEAHWIYQFSLPPLLLHALVRGTARPLAAWAEKLPAPPPGCAYLNITGTHDGIGLRPLEGLVPPSEIEGLVAHVSALGGRVSTRRAPGGSDAPYELNATWFDALGMGDAGAPDLHMARFLCAQAVLMAFKGIPAVYFNTLAAAANDHELASRTGMSRSLNRGKWLAGDLEKMLADPNSSSSRALAFHMRVLKLRGEHPAFHPDGAQKTAALSDAVLGIEREAPDGSERVLALANFGGRPELVSKAALRAHGWQGVLPSDLITGRDVSGPDGSIALGGYAAAWLREA